VNKKEGGDVSLKKDLKAIGLKKGELRK